MERGGRALSAIGAKREPSRDLGQLRRLAVFLAPYRLHVLGALIALVLAAASLLSLGIGLRYVIDGGFVAGREGALRHASEAVVLVILVLAAATYMRSYLVTWLGERVVADLRAAVYAKLLRLSPGYFEVMRTGEVLSRLTTDTSVIQVVIGASITQALRNLLLVIGGLALLVATNPRLAGIVALMVPLVVLPIVVIGRRVRRLSRAAQDRLGDSSARAEETLNAVRTVQSFAQEQCEIGRFVAGTGEAFTAAVAVARARAALGAIVVALVFGAIVAVLWVGSQDVLAGRISAGELSSFVFFATVVAGAFGGLSDVFGDLQRAAGATERLIELLDAEPAIAAPAAPQPLPARSQGAVAFEAVRFAYPAHPDRPVLDGVSFEVLPGQAVALVGPSGAGKTSVFQLLLRFYDPQEGRVLLDGQPLTGLDPAAFRARIGFVPQEPTIFSADAWTNIRYGRPDASDAEVRAAAEAAAALDFLEALPHGLSTFLGEKGVRLSGGQRQRIAIARALLLDPAVLLLDEATSALDAENERLVQAALERLMRRRTSIVIAHRLATVLRADRILVMNEGRIVDHGRHEELVRRDGLYARLAALQLAPSRAA
ncbi:MAG TPA: ABC transporter transmembrane domain-containing protein [Geminicoccaceae bacterium]|nr:ABC transporter transmembrane domain-containing protein [Geminicoccus sp.]HMU50719.1 ABC transporter transmembrane domain-containing protein [Geminicoccaceae bacterium]